MALGATPERYPTKPLLLAVLIACTAVAAPAEESPFSGKWKIHILIEGTDVDQVCTFTQKGNELTGTCDTQGGTVATAGKVDQKKITWKYKSQTSEGLLTAICEGTLDDSNKISGGILVEEMGLRGTFTANQAK